MTSVNVISLNIRGLRDGNKRREIFRWLKRYHKAENHFTFLQESHSVDTDCEKWKREWGANIFFSHGKNDARGVAILFPSRGSFDIEDSWSDIDGRIAMVKIKFENEMIFLINVYAPTKNNQRQQLEFFSNLQTVVTNNEEASLVIAGDFNTYLDPLLDKQGGNIEPVSQYTAKLQNLIDNQDLVDVWRTYNPTTKRFTWRQNNPLIQSRLDYFFISLNLMQNIENCDIKPSIKTDHSMLILRMTLHKNTQRGPGFWKFNSSLLKDIVYIDYMKEIISQLKDDYIHLDNKGLKWDYIKSEIRQRTITYSKTQARILRDYEDELKEQYEQLATIYAETNSQNTYEQLETTKFEIESINKQKTAGSIIRSKAIVLEECEKDAGFFSNLEKKNYKTSNITKLEKSNGELILEPKEILDEAKIFYENLYKHDETLSEDFDKYFLNNDIPMLTDDEKDLCESEITVEECAKVLKNMKNGKTPGTDGLSVEFYKVFWKSIKDLVFESFIYGYNLGNLSIDQRRGLIKLIPKKDKILTFLKNWRPISLLNTDYKILAHILAQRLQKVLPNIISKDQNGYIQGRFIGCSIRTILDMIHISQNEASSNLITFVDYEKAFDNIKWNFMHKSLKAFGFGSYFRKWIETLYSDVNSGVLNNGFSSAFFSLSKGIRQGCPLSALLFVMTVEILAIEIRNNPNVKGIKVGNCSIKITLLADDTTLFLKDVTSLQTVLNLMFMFRHSSGLKINSSKTQVMQVGVKDWNIKPFKLKSVKERIYSLGTWFYKDPQTTVSENLAEKFKEFKKILEKWQCRKLTLYGKIIVLKTFALSKLNYVITSVEISKEFVDTIQQTIFDFIWDHKKPKIKNDVSVHKIEDGGMKIPHIDYYVKANKAIWVKRLLNDKDNWVQYLKTYLPDISLKQFLKCNFDPDDLPFDIPMFYRQVLHAWFALKKQPINALDIRREILYFNKNIKIENKYMLLPNMVANNIYLINQIVDNSGKVLSYDTLCRQYGNVISHFDFMSLIDAIPAQWRKILKQQSFHVNVCNINESPFCNIEKNDKDIQTIKSSQIYWHLLSENKTKPTCITSWGSVLEINEDEKLWSSIFTLPILCVKDVKIREFQYKIIHRYYPSQNKVSKWDATVSNICTLCHSEIADIVHTFYGCNLIKNFWNSITQWLNNNTNLSLPLLCETVLLGIVPFKQSNYAVNHCLLYAKYFIHKEKANDKCPSFLSFLTYYKRKLVIERESYVAQDKLSTFTKSLGVIYDIM